MQSLQSMVLLALSIGAFGAEAFALVDAARVSPQSFLSAGKLTKAKWLTILGIAAALGFLALPGGPLFSLGFLNVIAFVAAAVYLADVRPAVKQIRGGGPGGPYGGW